ncbi:MAG: hypothetical protein MRY63_01765 [Neomegalonema sp.]|nr:hypothetical protein [Neomegalonema sp.]
MSTTALLDRVGVLKVRLDAARPLTQAELAAQRTGDALGYQRFMRERLAASVETYLSLLSPPT